MAIRSNTKVGLEVRLDGLLRMISPENASDDFAFAIFLCVYNADRPSLT